MNSGETVRAYHEWTSNSTGPIHRRPPRPAEYIQLDPDREPPPFKRYPDSELHPLPVTAPMPGPAATDALAGLTVPTEHPVDLTLLSRILRLSFGITRSSRRHGRTVNWRPASSAGNRHPLEAYVATGQIDGLAAGLYHYAPEAGALEQLLDGDQRSVVAGTADTPATQAFIILTGLPWRTAWKYAERGWRHVYWDAGTALANLLTLAEAHGLQARLHFGFDDQALNRFLDLDGRTEFPLLIVALGGSSTAHTHAAAARNQELPTPAEPPSAPIEFPLVTVAQQAGNLSGNSEVRKWRSTPAGDATHPCGAVEPAAHPHSGSIEELILRRVTTRRMDPVTVSQQLLSWAMQCATRPVSMDAVSTGHTLITPDLSVHGIADLTPGVYRYRNGQFKGLSLLTEPQARAQATGLCLDQTVAGNSAYTLFVTTDLESLLQSWGDRGYRMAQTEAGIVVGRLQLAAAAMGFGASGLTFFDDAVADAFTTHRSAMLACAVGVPLRHP
ncbi:hypothetical protein GCM10010425_77580 [Streptomyces spororaveus]|uniref:Nitroreductase domain-containing protein n=1 Tax=Streptomyces spororaveus TaxID=284039 RepID=A0ABQ3TQC8_9ACTN|nr:SagB family peptide dehydrogenase [Streptomyces spororaveus]GHI82613.1 hypothetical protein Sspor_81740 [Streptomyces spororaveus]